MDSERTRYVVTAWRNNHELLQLREDLYSLSISRREKAVNKVFAWRLRKPDGLPLMLDSTADIVDVVVQDERGGLAHNRLRLLYATALSRCVLELIDSVTPFRLTRRPLHPLFIVYSPLISSPPTNAPFTDP
jgi:ribosomal biogenesis protein LAS1